MNLAFTCPKGKLKHDLHVLQFQLLRAMCILKSTNPENTEDFLNFKYSHPAATMKKADKASHYLNSLFIHFITMLTDGRMPDLDYIA